MRIAFARFMLEGNAFSPVHTTLKDFHRTHFLEGAELLKACQPEHPEVKGFLKNLELSGFIKATMKHKDKNIETIPLFSGWSISGGPLAKSDFEEICNKLRTQLTEAGKIDGLFLALHGALVVEGEVEPEVILLNIIRKIIGKDVPVAVTFDLHGNMTREKIENIDILCAYRTNPHFDMARTGFRAGDLLIKTIAGEIKPVKAWRSLPMIMGGGNTISFFTPMNSIFKRLKQIEEDPRVLYCSVFMVHPYLDNPELGWTIHIITNDNQELAESVADELAEKCWEMRNKKPPRFLDPEEMLEKVRKATLLRKAGSAVVADTSDVVGAGGTGENTNLIAFLLKEATDLISYVSIRDHQVINDIWEKPIGETVKVTVGGKLQPEINPPLEVEGKILNKKDTQNFSRVMVLDLKHIKMVITEGMNMPMKPDFYEGVGLPVMKADITVVKNFFHFRIYYFLKNRMSLYVKTKGITDFDVFANIKTNDPVHPISNVINWQDTDYKRRNISHEHRSQPKVESRSLLKRKDRTKERLIAVSVLAMAFYIIKKLRKPKNTPF